MYLETWDCFHLILDCILWCLVDNSLLWSEIILLLSPLIIVIVLLFFCTHVYHNFKADFTASTNIPGITYMVYSNPLFDAWPVCQVFWEGKVIRTGLQQVYKYIFVFQCQKQKSFCLHMYNNIVSLYSKTHAPFLKYVFISKIFHFK